MPAPLLSQLAPRLPGLTVFAFLSIGWSQSVSAASEPHSIVPINGLSWSHLTYSHFLYNHKDFDLVMPGSLMVSYFLRLVCLKYRVLSLKYSQALICFVDYIDFSIFASKNNQSDFEIVWYLIDIHNRVFSCVICGRDCLLTNFLGKTLVSALLRLHLSTFTACSRLFLTSSFAFILLIKETSFWSSVLKGLAVFAVCQKHSFSILLAEQALIHVLKMVAQNKQSHSVYRFWDCMKTNFYPRLFLLTAKVKHSFHLGITVVCLRLNDYSILNVIFNETVAFFVDHFSISFL